jgi:hypothetical protein
MACRGAQLRQATEAAATALPHPGHRIRRRAAAAFLAALLELLPLLLPLLVLPQLVPVLCGVQRDVQAQAGRLLTGKRHL